MQGKHFLVVQGSGEIVGQGKIESQVAPGFYFCVMAGQVPVGQVMPVQALSQFLIFDGPEHLDEWLAANVTKPMNEDPENPGHPIPVAVTEDGGILLDPSELGVTVPEEPEDPSDPKEADPDSKH